jgi:hypothetical protein
VHEDAIGALELALATVGLEAVPPPADGMRADLVVAAPDAGAVELKVTATSVATADDVERLAHWRGEGVVPILVADDVPDAVRHDLDARNLSWLDRRGHLHLVAPGVRVDAAFTPTDRTA